MAEAVDFVGVLDSLVVVVGLDTIVSDICGYTLTAD